MDIEDLILSRPVTTTYLGGPIDGAVRDMPLPLAQAAIAASATEIIYHDPTTGDPIDPTLYRLDLAPPAGEPRSTRRVAPTWFYAGQVAEK